MENQRSLLEQTGEESQALVLPDTIKSEVNFLVFPFFALSRKGLKTKTKTEFRQTIKRSDEKLEILWNVSANPEYGYPGPFDREMHKAIEQIISEILKRDGKITNPIPLGSLYELCKRMGKSKFGGREYRKIKEALERITAVLVKSRGTFYSKGEERWVDDTFHLYDRLIFKGAKLPDGEIADTNYLFLGSWYVESLNAFYVKPIDYKYLQSLRSKIASRLYEILGVRFYGLQHRRQRCVWFEYDTLCQLLPITPQKYYSNARQKLQPAHEELTKTAFLSRVRWRKRSKTEWVIYYYPGKRAKEEIEKERGVSGYLTGQDGSVATTDRAEKIALESEDRGQGFISQLTNHGISRSLAKQLAEQYPERIAEKIEFLTWIKDNNPEKIRDDAAYLRRMIEEDWSAPKGFVPKKQIEQRHQALEKEYRERVKEAKAQAEEWAARPPEDRVAAPLDSWIWGEKQFSHHEPTEEEIEAKKQELIANLQTKGQYERQLIDEIERDIQSRKQNTLRRG